MCDILFSDNFVLYYFRIKNPKILSFDMVIISKLKRSTEKATEVGITALIVF